MQVREVVKHTPELAQLVVANGGVGALVEYCNDSAGNNRCEALTVALRKQGAAFEMQCVQ
jgi:hypothetical protein